jgi:hypothetical protein
MTLRFVAVAKDERVALRRGRDKSGHDEVQRDRDML